MLNHKLSKKIPKYVNAHQVRCLLLLFILQIRLLWLLLQTFDITENNTKNV